MSFYRRTVLCLLLVMLGCVFIFPAQPAVAQGEISALFINVGKADAILLMLEDQRYLVDTGTKKSFDALEQALNIYGVNSLDGVIITHMDKDHVGGLKKLLKSGIMVDRLYAGALYSDMHEHPAEEASRDYEIPMTWLSAGDGIQAGQCEFKVLGPLSRDPENENNDSLVMDLQTPHGNILLTGDMELEEEAELLDRGLIPRATVLKVAHHGEDDATSKRLTLTVKPQWAVISTSTEEEPDTPDSKIISRLWEVKAGVAVTQNAEVGIMVTLLDGQAAAEQIDLR